MPLHIYCKVTDDIWMTTVLMLPAPSCDPLPSHTPHPRLAKRSGLPSADGLRWTSSTSSNAQNAKAARTRPRVRLRRLLLPRRLRSSAARRHCQSKAQRLTIQSAHQNKWYLPSQTNQHAPCDHHCNDTYTPMRLSPLSMSKAFLAAGIV